MTSRHAADLCLGRVGAKDPGWVKISVTLRGIYPRRGDRARPWQNAFSSLLVGSRVYPKRNCPSFREGGRSVPTRDVSRLRCPKCARVARKPFSYNDSSWVRIPGGALLPCSLKSLRVRRLASRARVRERQPIARLAALRSALWFRRFGGEEHAHRYDAVRADLLQRCVDVVRNA